MTIEAAAVQSNQQLWQAPDLAVHLFDGIRTFVERIDASGTLDVDKRGRDLYNALTPLGNIERRITLSGQDWIVAANASSISIRECWGATEYKPGGAGKAKPACAGMFSDGPHRPFTLSIHPGIVLSLFTRCLDGLFTGPNGENQAYVTSQIEAIDATLEAIRTQEATQIAEHQERNPSDQIIMIKKLAKAVLETSAVDLREAEIHAV